MLREPYVALLDHHHLLN